MGGARGSPGRHGGEGVLSRRRRLLWWALGVYSLWLSSVVIVVIPNGCRHPLALALSRPLEVSRLMVFSRPLALSHPMALSHPLALLRLLALSHPLMLSLSLSSSAVVVVRRWTLVDTPRGGGCGVRSSTVVMDSDGGARERS